MSEQPITIPDNVLIPCPALSFGNRKASGCVECPHFGGIIDTMPKATEGTRFEQRYRIGCMHMVARRCTSFEV